MATPYIEEQGSTYRIVAGLPSDGTYTVQFSDSASALALTVPAYAGTLMVAPTLPTATRVLYADANGNVTSSANLAFSSDKLGIGGAVNTNYTCQVYGTSGLAVRSEGADGVYQDILVGLYINDIEKCSIKSTVSSNANQSGFQFQISNGGGSANQTLGYEMTRAHHKHYVGGALATTLDSTGLGIGTTPGYQLHINSDSAGKPGVGGLWTVVCDRRIKENEVLADLDICYSNVKNLPLKRFGFRLDCYSDAQIMDRNVLGWIAQDVAPIFPKAVSRKKFVKKPRITETILVQEAVIDDDGRTLEPKITRENIIQEEEAIEDCLDLNAGQLNAALYGAVQKLQIMVEGLQEDVAILRSTRLTKQG